MTLGAGWLTVNLEQMLGKARSKKVESVHSRLADDVNPAASVLTRLWIDGSGLQKAAEFDRCHSSGTNGFKLGEMCLLDVKT